MLVAVSLHHQTQQSIFERGAKTKTLCVWAIKGNTEQPFKTKVGTRKPKS